MTKIRVRRPSVSAQDQGYLYIPSGWGSYLAAGKARALAGGLSVWNCVGDSITRGYLASNLDTKGWVGLVRTAGQAALGDGGSGFRSSVDTSVGTTDSALATAYASQYNALTGTWTAWGTPPSTGSFESVAAMSIVTTVANSTVTFTGRGTKIEIFWLTAGVNNGIFTYAIDGGSTTSVDTGASAAGGYVTTISGLSAGSHTVVINVPTPRSTGVFISGVAFENTSGLIVNNFGRLGQVSGNMADPSSNYMPSAEWTGGVRYPGQAGDLLIYSEGLNDAHNNVSAATFQTNLATFLRQTMTGAARTWDLLVILPALGTYDGSSKTWAGYRPAIDGLVKSYNGAILDFWAWIGNSYTAGTSLNFWGTTDSASGSPGSDTVHPSDTGHALMAPVIRSLLGV